MPVRLLLVFTLLATPACAFFGPRLPAERPANFTIRYGHGGGMLPMGWTLFLSEAKSHYAHYNDGITNRIEFKTSPRELDEVYRVLRDNSFPRIKVSDDFAHDKAGHSIAIRYGREYHSIGTSGTFIARSWRSEWRAVRASLDKIKNREIAAQTVRVRVLFDASLGDKKINVYFGHRGLTRAKGSAARRAADFLEHNLLPGKYLVRVVLWKSEPRSYSSREYRRVTTGVRRMVEFKGAGAIRIAGSANRLRVIIE